jgi:small subunit ribosomal protein S6
LSDEARQKAFEKILALVTAEDGEVHKIHEWGRRRLAYEVSGRREGFYYVVYFEVKPAAIAELWREFHLNEDLLRFTTLRAEKVLEEIKFKSLEKQ